MPEGFLSIKEIRDDSGKLVSFQKAIDYGWIGEFKGKTPDFFPSGGMEYPVHSNLFVDQGRQLLAYAFGNRAPVTDNTVKFFGVGTSTQVPNVTDTRLIKHIALDPGVPDTDLNFVDRNLRIIDGTDFPAPFIVRTEATLRESDANGCLVTEFGLFSGSGIMMVRLVSAGINKTSDFSPVLIHRVRF